MQKYCQCKFVHACVVNVIHAKVLPGFVLYFEHWIKVKVINECIIAPNLKTMGAGKYVIVQDKH